MSALNALGAVLLRIQIQITKYAFRFFGREFPKHCIPFDLSSLMQSSLQFCKTSPLWALLFVTELFECLLQIMSPLSNETVLHFNLVLFCEIEKFALFLNVGLGATQFREFLHCGPGSRGLCICDFGLKCPNPNGSIGTNFQNVIGIGRIRIV